MPVPLPLAAPAAPGLLDELAALPSPLVTLFENNDFFYDSDINLTMKIVVNN